jgi:myo-inositol-1(or 4)-monophosphatase
MVREDDLRRIQAALEAAEEAVRPFTPGAVDFDEKSDHRGPVTAADLAINEALRRILPGPGEGWLSEETRDDLDRLRCRRVWVVDPLDGTREFVQGIPEWCISVGLVEDGEAVAGGILVPSRGMSVVGSVETGVTVNGQGKEHVHRETLDGAVILASRSEWNRGEWDRYASAPFEVRPCGSVAYKLAQVAAGLADGTWTLVPKHEWDVAGGAALVRSSGGTVLLADGTPPRFNQRNTELPNFLAGEDALLRQLRERWLQG